ncbi:hypothetical protein IAR55_005572 [Kwoniella newhampshirensis]|uniref:Transcription factor domain-containing protein n=1 Tax=Kwoniella newhampshirensis TaxID=1651941 RepID=A0AAW0YZE2_9TREE
MSGQRQPSDSPTLNEKYEILARRLEQVEAAYAQQTASLLGSSSIVQSRPDVFPTPTSSTPTFYAEQSTGSTSNWRPDTSYAPVPSSTTRGRHEALSVWPDLITMRPRPPDYEGFRKNNSRHPATIHFQETSMCAVDVDGFPDAVKRGLVNATQVDMYFQLFKHRFSTIAPLIPFLLTSSPLPKHPFVVIAALSFIPEALSANDVGIIEESVLYAMTGTTSVDAMLALYILSFASFGPSSEFHIPLTPLRLVSLAWTLGKDLGLELKARRILSTDERAEELLSSWNQPQLEQLTLWEAVKNRYSILQIQYARCGELPTLLSPQLPNHQSDHIRHCIVHLRSEAKLVEICRNLVEEVAIAEVESTQNWPDFVPLVVQWEVLLIAETYTLPSALALRLILLALCPPSPVAAETAHLGHNVAGGAWVLSARCLIHDFMPRLYSTSEGEEITVTLPVCVSIVVAIAIATARRILVVTRGSPSPPIDEQQVEAAERYLARLDGFPGRAMKGMWEDLSEYKENGNEDAEQQGLAELNFDLFDWDMLFPTSSSGDSLGI